MYLQRLYRHHKGWFAFVVVFALAQLFICVRRGVVCTPFYQYGMYSAVEVPRHRYPVLTVTADTTTLSPADFSAARWDMVVEPLHRFEEANQWNRQIWSANIQRLLGVRDSIPYLNAGLSSDQFNNWYKNYLSVILHRPVHRISSTKNLELVGEDSGQ
jgi:hypothetical protein